MIDNESDKDLTALIAEIDDAFRSLRHWQIGIGSRDETPSEAAKRLSDACQKLDELGQWAAERYGK